MTDEVVAQDIMRPMFLRVSTDHTLRETLGVLLDPQGKRDQPRVLIVLNPDGSFAGLVTLRDLLKAFLSGWIGEPCKIDEGQGDEREDGATAASAGDTLDQDLLDEDLLDALQGKLDTKIVAAMNSNVPVASPRDRLARLIELMRSERLDSLPVMENDRVVGIVHLADVFAAAARLALSSQT